MPFSLAARAFEMIVQATSISPFWNQLVKSGSSPSSGSFAFSFSKNAQARRHVVRDACHGAAARDLGRREEADAVVVDRDPTLEFLVDHDLPAVGRAVRERLVAIGQHVDVGVGVDQRPAVETDGPGERQQPLEIGQARQVLADATQRRLGRIGRRVPVDVDRRHAALIDRRPDLGPDLVVLGQVGAHRDAGRLGERLRHALIQTLDPDAAPGPHDQLVRLVLGERAPVFQDVGRRERRCGHAAGTPEEAPPCEGDFLLAHGCSPLLPHRSLSLGKIIRSCGRQVRPTRSPAAAIARVPRS